MPPDPKRPKRIKNPALLTELHDRGGTCALLGPLCVYPMSLHHIHKHPRDDVEENLAWLCGSGTTGHHGAIEHHDGLVKRRFGIYLLAQREDFMEYLSKKLRSEVAANEWLEQQGYLPPAGAREGRKHSDGDPHSGTWGG